MKVVGLVTEYNPFHNGHKYHLEKSKEKTSATHSIAVMSGNFLQRGEPALVDKWTRAKMAVDSGVDLVLELPTVFATQSAEYFSDGAVKILDSLGIVDSLCFGSELGDTSLLGDIAHVLVDEPLEFKYLLKEFLDTGLSFPKARSLALSEYFKNSNHTQVSRIEKVVESPNNILGIEYMKSLKKINSNIEPHTIQRIQSGYHDKDIVSDIASATSIREDYFKNKHLDNIRLVMPPESFVMMEEFLEKNHFFNHIDNLSQILLYIFRLVNYDKIFDINGMDEGIENRIIRAFEQSNELDEILKEICTKRYPLTRIKRLLMHTLLDFDKDTAKRFKMSGPRYIRVLGASKNGVELLSLIKQRGSLPIITKFSGHEKLGDVLLDEMISFDKKATDLFFTGLSQFTSETNMNKDFTTTPYFAKK